MNNLEKVRKPVHSKTMGIEIEGLLPMNHFRIEDVREKFHGFFFAGSDVSIRRNFNQFGVEFVSQPLPYSWLSAEIDKLGKKFQWTFNDSCGIHIHVNRKWVSEKRLCDLMDSMAAWSSVEYDALFGRPPNAYCLRPDRRTRTGRYSAINITGNNTVEFRMFRSGDAVWAKECLRRTKLMVEFKGKPTFDNLFELFTKPVTEN